MTTHHKVTIKSPDIGPIWPPSESLRALSEASAHLADMNHNQPYSFRNSGSTRASHDAAPAPTTFDTALTLRELADRLHVSVQSLYDLRSQGRGPKGFRVGRQLRFRESEIQAWLERLESEDQHRHPDRRTA